VKLDLDSDGLSESASAHVPVPPSADLPCLPGEPVRHHGRAHRHEAAGQPDRGDETADYIDWDLYATVNVTRTSAPRPDIEPLDLSYRSDEDFGDFRGQGLVLRRRRPVLIDARILSVAAEPTPRRIGAEAVRARNAGGAECPEPVPVFRESILLAYPPCGCRRLVEPPRVAAGHRRDGDPDAPAGRRWIASGAVNTGDGQFQHLERRWVAEQLVRDPGTSTDAKTSSTPHRNTRRGPSPISAPACWPFRAWWRPATRTSRTTSPCSSRSWRARAVPTPSARRLTGHAGAAGVRGDRVRVLPLHLRPHGAIQLLMTAGLPWSLWACHRLIDRPTAGAAVALGAISWRRPVVRLLRDLRGLSVGLAVIVYAVGRASGACRRFWAAVARARQWHRRHPSPSSCRTCVSRPPTSHGDRGVRRSTRHGGPTTWPRAWAHRWMLIPLTGLREVAFRVPEPWGLGAAVCCWPRPAAWTGRGTRRATRQPAGRAPARTVRSTGCCPSCGLDVRRTVRRPVLALLHALPIFGFLRAPGRFAILVTLGLVMSRRSPSRGWRDRAGVHPRRGPADARGGRGVDGGAASDSRGGPGAAPGVPALRRLPRALWNTNYEHPSWFKNR